MFSVDEFRKSFPQLARRLGKNGLVYFDNGASTLKHSRVTDRVNQYNRFEAANVHRGAHQVSRLGTEHYEQARESLKSFVNASDVSEIVFTRGTTESINLVATGLEHLFSEGDEILITPFEHHSNIVPWQRVCQKTGARLVVADFDPDQGITVEAFTKALTAKTKLASFLFYSNSFGQRLPVEAFIKVCKDNDTITMIDAAQAVLAEPIDVQALGCDFLCFSGHKMFGPYGIGICYIAKKWADELNPYQTGGSMIDRVTFEKTTYASMPQKFEAGTPNVPGAIGLGEAAEVVKELDQSSQHQHIMNLRQRLKEGLASIPSVHVYDFPGSDHTGVISFNIKGSHSSDVGTLLDKYGIAVRAGHHCTQPLMDLLDVPGTVRASVAPYNTMAEVEFFLEKTRQVEAFFL